MNSLSSVFFYFDKTVEELVEVADDKLFTNVKYNKQHVLHSTLPGTMDIKYNLRPRLEHSNSGKKISIRFDSAI